MLTQCDRAAHENAALPHSMTGHLETVYVD